ncbi:hypothetical protein [Streptomyces flaveolus]|uniref:hypothetical protein n=1 Tax=Streptomyces flaveolus TaxID=67297 RepID=UPI0036F641B5
MGGTAAAGATTRKTDCFGRARSAVDAEPWQTSFVRYWQATHQTGADNGLSFLAPLQHQQVYDPCFPQRWRTYVLSRSPTASGSATVALGIARHIPAARVVLPLP